MTEKGSNTTRVVSSVQDNQTACRRSSGDRYFPYFKERVADYAIKHTAKEAARYFGVNVDTVTMWTRGRYENDSVSVLSHVFVILCNYFVTCKFIYIILFCHEGYKKLS